MDDLAAQVAHALERDDHVRHGEVGKREAVARPRPALVDAEVDAAVLALPALALVRPALGELRAQEALPEAARPHGVVGRELDEKRQRHQVKMISPPAACS